MIYNTKIGLIIMKEFYFLLGTLFYIWAGYSAIRMLFTVNPYTGFEWILSIMIEVGFGMYFMNKSADSVR